MPNDYDEIEAQAVQRARGRISAMRPSYYYYAARGPEASVRKGASSVVESMTPLQRRLLAEELIARGEDPRRFGLRPTKEASYATESPLTPTAKRPLMGSERRIVTDRPGAIVDAMGGLYRRIRGRPTATAPEPEPEEESYWPPGHFLNPGG